MQFKVFKAGFSASIQDLGRVGLQAYGVSPSGVLDEQSATWANYLLHNDPTASLLEMPYGQVTLIASAPTTICTTGANCEFTLNRQPCPRYTPIQIDVGDILRWQSPVLGVRAYLAVSGGFNLPALCGSQSVNTRENLGNTLTKQMALPCHPPHSTPLTHRMLRRFILKPAPMQTLRLIEGMQMGLLSAREKAQFYAQTYQVSPDNNRTGCRLIAKDADHPLPAKFKPLYQNMISEGMTLGSVQLPPNGQPIVMLKDHPTIGGYPKLGAVFSLDLNRLAQCLPHTHIQFAPMSIQKAQQKRKHFNQFFSLSFC